MPKVAQLLQCFGAIMRGQPFFTLLSFLWGVKAEPDFPYAFALRPKIGKLLQVAIPLNDLPGNCAVNRNFMAFDVFQDALVCSGSPPFIVFGL